MLIFWKNQIKWKRNKNEMKCLVISPVLWSMLHLVGVQDDFHNTWCSWCITVRWWVPLMEQDLRTIPEPMCSSLVFCCVLVARSLFFCAMFCRSLFVLLSSFCWPLCCLFFFDLRILITPLISSHFKTLTFDSWMTIVFILMMSVHIVSYM